MLHWPQAACVVLGAEAGTNMAMDINEIMARNNHGVSTLFIQNEGGIHGLVEITIPLLTRDR
jgi:hypothetical protein